MVKGANDVAINSMLAIRATIIRGLTVGVLRVDSKKLQAKIPPQEWPKIMKDKNTPICIKRLCFEIQINGMKQRFDHRKDSLKPVRKIADIVAVAQAVG